MATQKTYKINIDVESKTLGQLENDLANINEELKDVDRNSEAFKNLSKQAQVLNQEIEKTNNTIEGMTLDKKLEAADGAAKVFGGSLSAVVGTLGVLGVESEVFGKFEEKAASAIAVGLGVKDVVEGYKQLVKNVKLAEVAQKAYNVVQRVFNALMSANPVGIVILSITTLVGLVVSLKDKFEAVNKVFNFFKKLVTDVAEAIGLAETDEEKAAKKFKESTDQRIKDINNEIKVRKAAGESTVKLERERLNKLIALTKEGTQERKDAEADLDAFEKGLTKEKEDREAEVERKAEEKRKKKADEKKAELNKEAKEAEEKRKKDAQKAIDDEKARVDSIAKILEDYKKRQEDIDAETRVQKLELEEQRKLEDLERLMATEEEIQAVRDFYKTQKDEAEILDEEDRKNKEREDQEKATAAIMKQLDLEYMAAQEKINIKKSVLDAVIGFTNSETAIGKAALVAREILAAKELVINAKTALQKIALEASESGVAVAGGFAKTLAAGFPQNIPLLIGYAAQAAGIVGSIKKAVSSSKKSLGGGAGIDVPSVSPGGSRGPSAPAPVTGPRQFDAPQTFQQTGPTVKAYVLSGDVKSSSEADAKIERRRTID